MNVYLWIAGMGVIGLIALMLFIYYLTRDLKFKKKVNVSFVQLIPNWLLLLCSVISFSMMIYFFLNVKEQLIQLGS